MRCFPLLWLCFFSACTTAHVLAQDNASAPPLAARPNATFDLKVKPDVGALSVMRLTARQSVELGEDKKTEMPAQKTTQLVSFDFNWKPADVLPNGDSLWKFWIIATRYERDVLGRNPVRYDSRRPPAKIPDEVELFHFMVNTGLTFRLNSRGQFIEGRDFDKMAEAIWKKMGVKSADRKRLTGILKDEFGDDAFASLGILMATFPAAPAAIGTRWPKSDPVSPDSNLVYSGSCTLQTVRDNIATIAREARIAPNPTELKKPKHLQNIQPVTGRQHGQYLVDATTGRTQSARLEHEYQARIGEGGFVAGQNGRALRMQMSLELETLKSVAAPESAAP